MNLGLKDKVVVVTGGGKGIGKTMALTFAREGSWVAVCGRTPEPLEATAQEVRALGAKALAMRADITKEADIATFMKRVVDEFGHIDVLVNNAAGSEGTIGIDTLTVDRWNAALTATLLGAVLCSREVQKGMVSRKQGAIINISSIRSKIGHPMMLPYSSAKAGLEAFTRSLAQALGGAGVRVNAIVVGSVSNQLDDPQIKENLTRRAALLGKSFEEYIKDKTKDIPIGRFVEPQEVANLAAFLASPCSAAITGQSINCDGGRVMF